jgi:hypothetical protein
MGQKDTHLTNKEFASQSGLSVTQVTKMLRAKKLAGEKQSGKWMIPASELKALGKSTSAAPATPPAKAAKKAKTAANATVYSVSEFSAMSYLTEAGVIRWLKQDRLKGTLTPSGEWQVDAASLELPYIKHLLRS